MLNDDRRTIEESYTSATASSNLRCEAEKRTDVDVLIAAGYTPGILGAALMRLHSEWDGCAHPRGKALTETDARVLMGYIKTLPRVLSILDAWAAERQAAEPKKLAQAVIAFWLDSICPYCRGRGKEVIPGTPALGRQCKACRGTGRKKEPGGDMGRLMLTLMDDCVIRARNSMRKRLRQSQNV